VPAGATVTITCKGKKGSCPFKRKVVHVTAAASKLSLGRYFKKAKLPKGTVIDVKVTAPGMTTVERKLKA
jgi:hypothetical protein